METVRKKKARKNEKFYIIRALLVGTFRLALALFLLALFVHAAFNTGHRAYQMGYRVFTEPAVAEESGEDILVTYTAGMSGKSLADTLEDKGLVRDSSLFYIQYRLSAYYNKLIPGTYILNTSMTAKDMLVAMSTQPAESTETKEQ